MCSKDKPNLEEVEELALHHVDGGLSTLMKPVFLMKVELLESPHGTWMPLGRVPQFTCGLTMP
jgi:hypothetical protein